MFPRRNICVLQGAYVPFPRQNNGGDFCQIPASFYLCGSLKGRSVRLGVRTPDFHSGNTGSIPVRTTWFTTISNLKLI